jgi:glucose-6-phosphate isomerase
MDKPVMAPYLDTAEATRQVDKTDIAGILADFPGQLARARSEFAKVALPPSLAKAEKLVFCGMGGSAIGAELACDLGR